MAINCTVTLWIYDASLLLIIVTWYILNAFKWTGKESPFIYSRKSAVILIKHCMRNKRKHTFFLLEWLYTLHIYRLWLCTRMQKLFNDEGEPLVYWWYCCYFRRLRWCNSRNWHLNLQIIWQYVNLFFVRRYFFFTTICIYIFKSHSTENRHTLKFFIS